MSQNFGPTFRGWPPSGTAPKRTGKGTEKNKRPRGKPGPPGVGPPPVTANLTVWANLETLSLVKDVTTPIAGTDGETFTRLYLQPESSRGAADSYFGCWNIGGPDNQTYRTSINGYPCLELPPTHLGKLFDSVGAGDPLGVTSDQCTLFIVAAYSEVNNYTGLLSTRALTTDKQYVLNYDTRTQKRHTFSLGASSGQVTYSDLLARDTNIGIRVLATQCGGSLGNLVGWKDGVKQNTVALATNTYYNAADSYIGIADGSSRLYGTVYFYEVLVYDALLSDADTGLVNDWLTAKFGM